MDLLNCCIDDQLSLSSITGGPRTPSQEMESILEKKLQHQSSTPNKLDINYLRAITKNFSEDQILGRGGFGIVYKGEQENGETVAVKKLKMSMVEMDDKQFMNEVKHAIDICHPNIVRLEGYCYHTEKELLKIGNESYCLVEEIFRLLCFEYLPNGSLDKYISDESSGLDWHVRYNIIEGICKGLHCLHEGRKGAPILHLDLKPANILLDKNMMPKIADFGLSRLIDEGKTHTCAINLTGTRGYMAPEYIERYVLSKETDIFSLGVIIIEIVTGHRKYPKGTTKEELVEVHEKWKRRLQTTSNKTSLEEECQQVHQCIEVGLKCMDNDPNRRPTIREVVQIIKRSENIDSCSVTTRDGSDAEEQSGELVHSEWDEKLNTLVLGSPEQAIEAMKIICHWLKGLTDNTSLDVPEYIIKDADRLVSDLTVMIGKSFILTLGTSSRQLKHALNTLFQTFQIRHLAQAVKEGTLEKLVTLILIWLSTDTVLSMELDDARELRNVLNDLMLNILDIVDRTSIFVILINLLLPLDPSRWPSYTPLELLAAKNTRFSDLVVKCLIKLTKALGSTIDTIDLDRILQNIHVFFELLGTRGITRRAATDDKPQRMIKTIVHELVKLLDSKIKDHLSMVPIDAEPQPVILELIELLLEAQDLAAPRVSASSLPVGQTHGDETSTGFGRQITKSTLDGFLQKLAAARVSASSLPMGQTHGDEMRSTNFGRQITKSTLETALREKLSQKSTPEVEAALREKLLQMRLEAEKDAANKMKREMS